MTQIVLWLVFLLPFASLFFLDRTVIRRYLSVAFLITILNVIIYEIAWSRNWWRYNESLFDWDKETPASIVFSSYWIVTIWIFYLTFRRYWVYLTVNVLLDGGFQFIVVPWMQSHGLRSGTMPTFTVFLIMLGYANIIYLYQLWYEGTDVEIMIAQRRKTRT